jgi:hypothetical protein
MIPEKRTVPEIVLLTCSYNLGALGVLARVLKRYSKK